MYDIYLAAPLFSIAEQHFNLKLCNILINQGLKVYLPQDVEILNNDLDAVFPVHTEALINSKSVLAVLDGADADSGTCWEVGFFYGYFQCKRPIFSLRTDLRKSGDSGGYNLMLKHSTKPVTIENIENWERFISYWKKIYEIL